MINNVRLKKIYILLFFEKVRTIFWKNLIPLLHMETKLPWQYWNQSTLSVSLTFLATALRNIRMWVNTTPNSSLATFDKLTFKKNRGVYVSEVSWQRSRALLIIFLLLLFAENRAKEAIILHRNGAVGYGGTLIAQNVRKSRLPLFSSSL